jgi:hypothetical protein
VSLSRAIARFTGTGPAEPPLVKSLAKTGMGASRRTMGLVHLVDELAAARDGDSLRYAAKWLCGNGSVDVVVVAESEPHGGLCERCIDRKVDLEVGLVVVYRCFDSAGDLLYVGSTTRGGRARIQQHRYSKAAWCSLMDPERTTFEPHTHEIAARAAESRAIRSEHPRFNKAGRRVAS